MALPPTGAPFVRTKADKDVGSLAVVLVRYKGLCNAIEEASYVVAMANKGLSYHGCQSWGGVTLCVALFVALW
jgi:hypothetical protein